MSLPQGRHAAVGVDVDSKNRRPIMNLLFSTAHFQCESDRNIH